LCSTSITSSPTKLFNHPEFDIWAIGPNGTVDIRIVDTDKGRAKQVAMKFYDHCDVIIKDVNKFLKEMEWTKANTSDNWFDAYVRSCKHILHDQSPSIRCHVFLCSMTTVKSCCGMKN
jgi:hypothetical protein